MSVNGGRSTSVAKSVALRTTRERQQLERSAPERFPFTEARLSELRPNGRTAYYYDVKCQGLAVRTTANTKTFCFYGRLHSKVVRITLGRVGRLSLMDARNAVGRIRGDAAKGIDVVVARKALATKKPAAERLADRFERFVGSDRHRPKTVKDYRSLWNATLPLHWPTSLSMASSLRSSKRCMQRSPAGWLAGKRPSREGQSPGIGPPIRCWRFFEPLWVEGL